MKKFVIVIVCFLILIVSSFIGYHVVCAKQMVDEVENLILEQQYKEKYFSSYGYTMDNPNIIVNPYDVSPLTALILFETEKKVSISITVEGKNHENSYSNTFISSKKHCIPVYGLYANYENKVILSYENNKKEITIKTDALPSDFQITSQSVQEELSFFNDNKYSYVLDKNNDVRWFLTMSYTGNFNRLSNGHFLLKNDFFLSNQLFEIDMFGKIYHQYNIEGNDFENFVEVGSSLFILSDNLLEIDKQSGTMLNKIKLDRKYYTIYYDQKESKLKLGDKDGLVLKDIQLEHLTKSDFIYEGISSSMMYFNDEEYKVVPGVLFSNHKRTEESHKNIFLVGYKKTDNKYSKYHVKFKKNSDYLQISGDFVHHNQVYVILDKFLDKKIYDFKDRELIINKADLRGKYSIYIKVDDVIYRTNYYVKF